MGKLGRDYSIDELEQRTPDDLVFHTARPAPAARTARDKSASVCTFEMRSHAELDCDYGMQQMVGLLCEDDPDGFGQTWYRKNRKGDLSQSGRDMRLACYMVRDGVDNQRIVDVLRWHRLSANKRIDTQPDKADRDDYYDMTIAKARSLVGEEAAAAAVSVADDVRVSKVVEAIASSTGEEGASDDVRGGWFAALNSKLRLPDECPITEIRRTPAADTVRDLFAFTFGEMGVLSLSSSKLASCKFFMKALPMAVGVAPPSWDMKKPADRRRWVQAQLLIRALAVTPTTDTDAELSEACTAIVGCVVAMYDDDGVEAPCRSEIWHAGVLAHSPAIWTTNRGSGELGILVPRSKLMDKTAKILPKETQALVQGVFGTVNGFETVSRQALEDPKGPRTRRGLVRVRLCAIREHGSVEEAEHILQCLVKCDDLPGEYPPDTTHGRKR